MSDLLPTARTRMARALVTAVAILPATGIAASACIPPHGEAHRVFAPGDTSAGKASSLGLPSKRPAELLFSTAGDASTFHGMAVRTLSSVPDAHAVAKAFIKERLGIEGDEYVVAHFATADDRLLGKPDNAVSLSRALMEAFPDHSRHSRFAKIADALGGFNGGGSASPNAVSFLDGVVHSKNASDFFGKVGRFLLSKTGPGYVYNTFFARGNVIETWHEDARPLDEAFGIYRVGGFSADYASPLLLSQVVAMFGEPGVFSELPYVKKLDGDLDTYWEESRADWPVLARYAFVQQARHALDTGVLTRDQYRLVMKGGAPRVPLDGPVTLDQLRTGLPDGSVGTCRFDINGYPASNLVRFVGADGSEVMYVPGGDPVFVAAKDERELRQWVVEQTKDAEKLDALLSHFSIYDNQDGTFWTGVKQGLENIGNGTWRADDKAIDHGKAAIDGDVFEDMRTQTEGRLRDDARMQASTAWDAWRTRINRTASVLAPLGYIPLFAIPIQLGTGIAGVGTGIDQAVRGRTTEERKSGLEQAALTVVTNVPLGAAFGGKRNGAGETAANTEGERPFFNPPWRMNDGIGYPLSPTRPPRLPVDSTSRLYARQDGTLSLWVVNDVQRHIVQMPEQARPMPDGTFVDGDDVYGAWKTPGGSSAIRLIADGAAYRMVLDDGTTGPFVKKDGGGAWDLAFTEDEYVEGSILAHMLPHKITTDANVFSRAAQILKQFGSNEELLPRLPRLKTGATTAGSMVMMSLGHGFIETLPARLRDPTATAWTLMEMRLIAPIVTERIAMPLAVFDQAGKPLFAVLPDGSEVTPELLPLPALRLRQRADGYVVLNRNMRPTQYTYRTIFGAAEASVRRLRETQELDEARLERDFRSGLADSIDGRSTRPELERMHRLWVDPLRLPDRQKQLIKELSRLRHALVDRHETLTSEQMRTLVAGRLDPDGASPSVAVVDARADGVLARIAERESALLPDALDFLTVKDPVIREHALTQAADEWTVDRRHYVRLRHLDGRMQIVETNGSGRGTREILEPGSGADRTTGRVLVRKNDMWYPEQWLRDGFAPIDPREHVAAAEAVAAKLPVPDRENHEAIARIVDSIPQPLLRLFSTSLEAIDVAADGGLALKVRHAASGLSMVYLTHVGTEGWPIPAPADPMPPEPLAPFAVGRKLVLPILRGTRDGAPGSVPNPDPHGYEEMVRSERPISAFVARGFGDRHVSALTSTRRVRGMLREDTNVALVGATPEHALTLVLPADAGTMRWIRPGRSDGRLLGELPRGTVIVDNLYQVSALAEKYPALVREIARGWEASGSRMLRIGPDGREETESPVAFTERLLATPLRINLWNPKHDPISERRYVEYLHRRHASGSSVQHPGLDWLVTPEARRDYMSYFAPPSHIMPFSEGPLKESQAALRMQALAEAAVDAGLLK